MKNTLALYRFMKDQYPEVVRLVMLKAIMLLGPIFLLVLLLFAVALFRAGSF